MATPVSQSRNLQVVHHPSLTDFNKEFGAQSDLSRYDRIKSHERATSQEVVYLNQLQMDGYIPARIALLLKNNLHDLAFTVQTTRSVLYELKQNGKIGNGCFNFLHERVNAQDFVSVFRYLHILTLYSEIAKTHNANQSDEAFSFESPAVYSDRLVRSQPHTLHNEERQLQNQVRKQFLNEWLSDLGALPTCPKEVQQRIFSLSRTIDQEDKPLFRTQLLTLLEKLDYSPDLEKICWKEFYDSISPFQGEEFYNQAYLRLKTESYYRGCVSRVSTLRQSLEGEPGDQLLALSEKCKKAYNGCVYLLGDSKNMAAISPIRFAALTGKMRTEWQGIDNLFSKARDLSFHTLCSCHVQTPPNQIELASWPFNSHPLIDLKPAQPFTRSQLEARGVSAASFEENQKKTVAIIGCKWGGGHMEVSRGIANNLSSLGYHPITVDLPEILISEDPVRNLFLTRWLGKKWSIATLFEGLLKQKAFGVINFLRWISAKFFASKGYSQTNLKLIMEHLLKLNPDSVITTYSADNEALIEACRILGIPCIHVCTDVDTTVETRDQPTEYPHFKMAIPFNAHEAIDPIINATTPEQRVVSGPPVRHAFTLGRTPDDIRRFKEKWGIEANKKVVVITNGKNGATSPYAEILARKHAETDPDHIPIHVVVICGGGNTDYKRHLEQNVAAKTKLPMTVELSYPEDKMEELMAMASYGGALVGKAGGGTIFETFTRGTRVLVDNVRPALFSHGISHFLLTIGELILRKFGFARQLPWEKVNMEFAKKHGLAETFREEKDFLPKLELVLKNDGLPVKLNVEVKNVEQEIPRVLGEMFAKAHAEPKAREARRVLAGL